MTKIKQITAISIIIAILISILAPFSNAETGGSNTITLKGPISGKILKIYRILNYDVINRNYTFTSAETDTDAQKEIMRLSQKFFFEVGFKETPDATTTTKFTKVVDITEWLKKHTDNPDVLMYMAEQYYTYATSNGLNPVETVDLTGQTLEQKVVSSLKTGYYLIYDTTDSTNLGDTSKSSPMLSIVPLTGTNAEIVIKSDTVSKPDKTVNPETANVGDTVTFTITSTVPKMLEYTSYTFDFIDQLSSGLDFVSDSVSIKLSKTGKADQTLVKDTNYSVDYNTTTRKLTISMIDFVNWRDAGYSDADITLTYKAKLNNDAIEAGTTVNSVKIKYSNNPTTNDTGETEPDTAEVKVYNLEFTKKNSDGELLQGAGFSLYLDDENEDHTSPIKFDSRTNTIATSETPAEYLTEIVYSDANGKFNFNGLQAGDYKLTERNVSDANIYRLPRFDMHISIIQESETAATPTLVYHNDRMSEKGYVTPTSVTVETETVTLNEKQVTSTRYTLTADVLNTLKDSLPSTGGMGTVIFTVAGIALMAGAVIVFIVNKKKNS